MMISKPVDGAVPADESLPDDEAVVNVCEVLVSGRHKRMEVRTSKRVQDLLTRMHLAPAPPVSFRSKYYTSRIVLVNNQLTTVLDLLATVKFGVWKPHRQRPYWKDADWTNECLDNIVLPDEGESFASQPRMSKYGVKSGTKEYWRKYREANRDRNRQYQRDYYRKSRKQVEEVTKAIAEQTHATSKQNQLADIFAEVGVDLDALDKPDFKE